uniref:Uncharacterized protein n=1 Tax=uncultured nuHF1 cluster bacterium HF0130_31E21 TaxID=710728 RepID=E0XTK3_9BACT|nr:hypothetical protein [uncultured nuHF1 cluster bacterium HF0130_31E21]
MRFLVCKVFDTTSRGRLQPSLQIALFECGVYTIVIFTELYCTNNFWH